MLMFISPFSLFVRALLLSWTGRKKESLLVQDLFQKFSYRYSPDDGRSLLSPFRYFRKSLVLLFGSNTGQAQNTETITYDSSVKFRETDEAYLAYNGVEKTGFIFRDALPNRFPVLVKFLASAQLFFVFCMLLPLACLKRDKAKVSLILLELTENALLVNALLQASCKELYFFSPYEKDSFFTNYLLARNGIKTYLVPSSNPISIYYKRVCCDTFIFTAPFQKKEFEKLKYNWFFKNTKVWKPFESQTVKKNQEAKKDYPYDIGFVSSGMYVRNKLSHNNSMGSKDYMAEMSLISALKNYRLQKKAALLVYLHPVEKSSQEVLNLALSFYRDQFGDDIGFAPVDEPTKLHFDLAEIAVSGFSSAQIERLYGGYKTIFAPMGHLGNYFNDDRLSEISAETVEDLERLVEKARTMGDEDFFRANKLEEYRWSSYT